MRAETQRRTYVAGRKTGVQALNETLHVARREPVMAQQRDEGHAEAWKSVCVAPYGQQCQRFIEGILVP